jgi:hypothetical protein
VKNFIDIIVYRMLDAVKVAGNHRNSPAVIDVAESCPSCRDVQEGFVKLKKLFMTGKIVKLYVSNIILYPSQLLPGLLHPSGPPAPVLFPQ